MASSSTTAPILRRQTAPFQFPGSSPNDEVNHNSQIPSTPLKFRGIPFSWERIPGIPKHQITSNKNQYSSDHLLPLLPPPAGSSIPKKLLRQEDKHARVHQRDPFFAALVACSKDDGDHDAGAGSSKITRSLSDRFGFMNMSAAVSCKSISAVAESVVYLPRDASPPYNYLHRRST